MRSRGLVDRARVERRLRVVLDAELHRLRELVARDARREREAHVDAGRHAGRGDDTCPARRRAAPVGIAPYSREARRATPSASSPPCPRADRPPRAASSRCRPTSSTCASASIARIQSRVGVVVLELARREAAGHDDDVGLVTSSMRVVGDEREELVVGADLAALCLATKRTSASGQALQHLVRADDVERGDAVEQEAGDLHGCSLCGRGATTPARDGIGLGSRAG